MPRGCEGGWRRRCNREGRRSAGMGRQVAPSPVAPAPGAVFGFRPGTRGQGGRSAVAAPESSVSRGLRRLPVPRCPGLAFCGQWPARRSTQSAAWSASVPVAGSRKKPGRRAKSRGSGSGNETLQELAARFGSARRRRPVIAVEFAHDPDHPVDRREAFARHRAEAKPASIAWRERLRTRLDGKRKRSDKVGLDDVSTEQT